ncbi:MAG: PAS domain S-box protein [Deltaproteobacteria bacterium]|nr:PAS domain S-box protein [Deltaproteobacteria bacterium]
MRKFFTLCRPLLGWATALTLLVFGALAFVVEVQHHDGLIRGTQRQGEALGRQLASTIAAPLHQAETGQVVQLVSRVAQEPHVVYVGVFDRMGRPLVLHPQGTRLPIPEGAYPAPPASQPIVREVPLSRSVVSGEQRYPAGESVLDIALPVFAPESFQQQGGVRLGIGLQSVAEGMARTRRQVAQIGVITLLAVLLVSLIVARRTARPLRALLASITSLGQGRPVQWGPETLGGEVGELAEAFDAMARQLSQQREELERANGQLAKQIEELALFKRYHDTILRAITLGVLAVDLEGRVVTCNQAAERIIGHRLPDIRGKSCRDAFGSMQEINTLLWEALLGHETVTPQEIQFVRPDGARVPIEVTTSVLLNDRRPLEVLAVLKDLSSIRELEEQMRRSDRLAALGTLAAGIAHEIKNPLTAIRTFSQLLPEKYQDESFRERFTKIVPQELGRINRIVNDLLQLAKPGRIEPRPVSLRDLLDQAVELHAERLEQAGITVQREFDPVLPRVPGDPDLLYRAFRNLIANAIEAMPQGGTLRVAARGPLPPGGEPTVLAAGPAVEVEVADTGTGIAEGIAGQLFNPFFTTKPKGTGLGLAVTHQIVEEHHGAIRVSSEPGRGSRFIVTLPVSQPARSLRSSEAEG